MTVPKLPTLGADLWGGLAAMLVALPSAIAFGVTIYAALGGGYGAYGAMAGILGATALGLVAPLLGGTSRLITAPCAPAAAVLSAFVIERIAAGTSPETVMIMLVLTGVLGGLMQVGFGLSKLGTLIKYMPYPVVSGYLSGVGLYIIAAQAPRAIGAPPGTPLWEAIGSVGRWRYEAILVALATAAAMVFAARITRRIPAAILALVCGAGTYFALGFANPGLWRLTGNPFVIGSLGAGASAGFFDTTLTLWGRLWAVDAELLLSLVVPAMTLSVLLSIDTLKTCVVLDALTRSRHDSNRELLGQGSGNITSALIGGIPGAGTMGATLVNISSGGTTKVSAVMEGVFSLAAFLALGTFIAWVPISALAAILIVIGVKMIDRHSFHFLHQRSTILDFVVIAAVVATALTVSLIAASGVGIALAIVLFIREQIGSSIIRRVTTGATMFSRRIRPADEVAVLQEQGARTVIAQLQGSLFFGTTDKLFTALEGALRQARYLILDFRRVQSVDITAAHMLETMRDILCERGATMIFAHIPKQLPTGKDIQQYFDQVGLVRTTETIKVFDDFDDALSWTEERIIAEAGIARNTETALSLSAFELFAGRKEETIRELEPLMVERRFRAGEKIFSQGDCSDELYLIRKGSVAIVLPLANGSTRHLSTFGQKGFFGEMAFLDHADRSADAIAETPCDLYVLSRGSFDRFSKDHKKAALGLMEGLARVLAGRLRVTNAELRSLES